MIASLYGKLESLGGDGAVINVGGIGFRVYIPTSTLSTLSKVGGEVKLHTYLHLREDNASLYGFASTEELGLFQNLISVSGLGPRLALAMLSSMTIENLSIAIATSNADLLTEIPGIGRRTAGRIILELKEKIGADRVTAPELQIAAENADVMAVLASLGYSVAEANRAVASLPTDSKINLEDKVKQALQFFNTK